MELGARESETDELCLGGRRFRSRLFIGTGKYPSLNDLVGAIEASGSELVTVALRRVDLTSPGDEFIEVIERTGVLFVPNTSGARNAEEAVRSARLSREAGGGNWIKLELTPEPRHLLPDPIETLRAAEILAGDGFIVLPYINADPVLSRRLEECGCAAVMPLGSPIGTNRGIETREMIGIIIEASSVPVVVDAGIGMPSHAAEAMELGADAVLVNTAIATAREPAETARAFALAVEAGRIAFLKSGVTSRAEADPSSPIEGFVGRIGR